MKTVLMCAYRWFMRWEVEVLSIDSVGRVKIRCWGGDEEERAKREMTFNPCNDTTDIIGFITKWANR